MSSGTTRPCGSSHWCTEVFSWYEQLWAPIVFLEFRGGRIFFVNWQGQVTYTWYYPNDDVWIIDGKRA